MSNEIVAVGKTADSLAVEVRTIVQVAQRQIHQVVASAAMDIGDRLTEAKKLVPHGEWEAYVRDRCGLNPRTAQTYMQMAANREKAQTFADLPFSKALALLALPEGQAEAFAAEHNPEELSTRQLRDQIKVYQAKLAEAADAGKAQQQQLLLATEENGALRQRLDGIDADYKEQLSVVGQENDRLREELAAAKNKPAEISEEEAAKLRAEGYAQGFDEGTAQTVSLERQLAEQAKEHEKALADLADETREAFAVKDAENADLKAQLTAAAQTPAGMRTLVVGSVQDAATAVGDNLNRMHGWYLKVKDSEPQLAGAIRRMVEAQISQMYSKFDIDPI
jgi:hypothetical protein